MRDLQAVRYIKTITNLFNYYGMLLAATQQKLMDFKEDAEKYTQLVIAEAYYQGVLDTLEGFLGLLEEEEVGKTDNTKHL